MSVQLAGSTYDVWAAIYHSGSRKSGHFVAQVRFTSSTDAVILNDRKVTLTKWGHIAGHFYTSLVFAAKRQETEVV